MNRFLGSIVAALILSAYILMHAIAGRYLETLVTGAHRVVWTLCVISFASLFLIRWRRDPLTRSLYRASMVWWGAAFFLALFSPLLRLFGGHRLWPVVAMIAILSFAAYSAFVPRVKRVQFTIKKRFKPLRIVQISDVHLGEFYGGGFLARVVRAINQQSPDVVVLTGDLFDGTIVDEAMAAPLKEVGAPLLFVSGNHEHYAGLEASLKAVESTGAIMLDGKQMRIGDVTFAGEGYKGPRAGKAARDPSVLLKHVPSDPKDAADAGYDLQLSGHTHHGQIWPLSYLVRLQFPVRSGIYQDGDFTMYVSQGTGTWGPPLRLGSRSEITVIELRPAS